MIKYFLEKFYKKEHKKKDLKYFLKLKKKRIRRRKNEVNRKYKCTYDGCNKSYG